MDVDIAIFGLTLTISSGILYGLNKCIKYPYSIQDIVNKGTSKPLYFIDNHYLNTMVIDSFRLTSLTILVIIIRKVLLIGIIGSYILAALGFFLLIKGDALFLPNVLPNFISTITILCILSILLSSATCTILLFVNNHYQNHLKKLHSDDKDSD